MTYLLTILATITIIIWLIVAAIFGITTFLKANIQFPNTEVGQESTKTIELDESLNYQIIK